MYSVMWSEHCSYKSSRVHLGRFPTEAPWVLVGPGEGAGVIDVGDGLAVAVRIESHNHPSAVEPYQGAATGVGGIIRDIFSMGARPIALMDPLRFGPLDDARTRYLFEGVVAGISGYGNAVGVPTVGGEVVFDECYRDNPLVNVLCLGMLPIERLVLAQGRGRRQPRGAARLVDRARRHRRRERARVGRVRGGRRGQATVGAGRRPVRGEAAHRGVPRAARRRARGRRAGPRRGRPLVRGVGDRGEDRRGHGRRRRARRQARAGHEPGRGDDVGEPGADARDRRRPRTSTRCSSSRGGGRSARRSSAASPTPARFRVFDGLFDAIGVPGENPPPPRGDDAPRGRRPTARRSPTCRSGSLGDGPVYHRPLARPAAQDALQADDPAPELRAQVPAGADLGPSCSRCSRRRPSPTSRGCRASTTTSCSSTPSSVRARDAAVLRLKGTDEGARARHRRQGAVLPARPAHRRPARRARSGAQRRVRRRATARARELPELRQSRAPRGDVAVRRGRRRHERGVRSARHPGRRRQRELLQRVARRRHRSDARRRRDRADRRARATRRRPRPRAGDAIVVLGATRPELGGSEWAAVRARRDGGHAAGRRSRGARALHDFVAELVPTARSRSARRSDGGLAVALAEMAFGGEVGFRSTSRPDGVHRRRVCFAESTSRVVLAVAPRPGRGGARPRGRRGCARPGRR